MLLKNKRILNETDYYFCEKIGSVGEYDFYHIKDDSEMSLNLVGKNIVNLSDIPRTTIGFTVRPGDELLEIDFFTENYNLDKFKTYYIIEIMLSEHNQVFIFDVFEDAANLQYNLLKFKSNGFFETEEVPLQFENNRFKKEPEGG